jgi:hypothetical protein
VGASVLLKNLSLIYSGFFAVYMKELKSLNNTAYNFSVSLILIPFFIILNFLNKKESKVICKREFEIILLQTQSLSVKPFN